MKSIQNRELVLRVAFRALTPPLSLFRSGGSAARREGGLGGWFSPVDSSSRSRCWLCFAPVASGVMPLSSFPSARASRVRWSLTAAQACCPWRTGADGSGSGESSLNKLEGRLDLTKAKVISPYTLCHRGGGRGVEGVLVFGCFRSAVASEMALRRWIQSSSSCSVLSSSSMLCSGGATAPSGAFGHQRLLAGLDRSLVDCSCRRAALRSSGASMRRLRSFLPAKLPDGRQFGNGTASVSPFSGKCWRRSNGEIFIPSGCVPGDGDFGSLSKPQRRWTTLQSSARAQGLFCKVFGLGCVFIFSRGPWFSCTQMQNE